MSDFLNNIAALTWLVTGLFMVIHILGIGAGLWPVDGLLWYVVLIGLLLQPILALLSNA